MRKICMAFMAALLLFSVASAETKEEAKIEQPLIFDAEFTISLSERTLAVSFQYSGVAGSVEDANIMLFISENRLTSGKIRYFFIADTSKVRTGEKIPQDTITQGKTKFLTDLPDNVDINELHDIAEIGIGLVDSLGRKSPPIILNVKIPNTIGI